MGGATPIPADPLTRRAEELQTAADLLLFKRRRFVVRFIKLLLGSALLIEGTVGLGLADLPRPDAVLVIVGTVFLVDGVWSIISLTPGSVLMNAVSSVVLGVWAIAGPGGEMRADAMTLVGIVMLGVGYWHVRRHLEYRRLYDRKPDGSTLELVDEIMTRLHVQRERPGGEVVELILEAFPTETPWLVDLSGPVAFLYHPMSGRMVCLSPRQFGIGPEDEDGITPVRMRERTVAGSVSTEARAAIEAWHRKAREAPQPLPDPGGT